MVSGAANDGLILDFERNFEYCLQPQTLNFDWTDLLFQRMGFGDGCAIVIVITVFATK